MPTSQKDLGVTRHTLLALVGGSPQIVSESIYALFKHRNIVINDIKIVTTSSCKEKISKALLEPKDNGFTILEKLTQDYDLPPIQFEENDIWVPKSSCGNTISDVTTAKEMNAIAQCLLDNIKRLTSCESQVLHASLAGGRKTMTFYLSYAMSIFARPQDTLSHVFVSPDFEHCDFFYPTPYKNKINTVHGVLNSQVAHVTLSNIPYVQLRPSLPKRFLTHPISIKDTELVFEIINRPLSLDISVTSCELICSGVKVKLTKANMAFYLIMVDDLLNGHEGFDCPSTSDKTLAILYIEKRLKIEGKEYKLENLKNAIYVIENKHLILKDSEVEGLRHGLKKSFFTDRKNQISQALRNELPENIAEHYDIDSLSKSYKKSDGKNKNFNYFGINIDQSIVRFIG
ncbi:CRISPR-associated ring nuclease Csm6 [Thalassotalea ponticola]|uniref:CRISPR-associated ring nuclease Csm6 n=1 Tax=Thalassotalea ponticola TaxID=1523392 RepID=UPI0025B34F0C|nr:CRISPR-associated ring nuclease Csm6 [Thalassotalea ponticola]MDN3652755.1 CRISPR-associated ring nuclease Csm6 [Thalassotalea ponticola]